MSKRILVYLFESEEDFMGAVLSARERDLKIIDTFTPYAVHGLDKALRIPPTRLTWACFIFGLLGIVLMTWFQFWVSAVDWPINVGGKPWNSLPAFVPAIFEMMVLFGGVGMVIAFLVTRGLIPGRQVKMVASDVTDDKFAMVIEKADASYDTDALREYFERFNVVKFEEKVVAGDER